MKPLLITLAIIGGLLLGLWGATGYISGKISLREKQARFALSGSSGNNEQEKQALKVINKTVNKSLIMLVSGSALTFFIISYLNKPKTNHPSKQATIQS
jgi:hypothetical protein